MKKNKKLLSIMTVLLLIVCMAVPVSAATKISKKKATLKVGQTLQLKVTGTKKKAKWTSSKKSVATVSPKGRVKAKKKGTATITAKVGKKKYTCKVTVKNAKNNTNKKPQKYGVTYHAEATSNGEVIILQNNYNYAVAVDISCAFYSKGQLVTVRNQYDVCVIESGMKYAVFMWNNSSQWDSVKVNLKTENVSYFDFNAKNITYTSNWGTDGVVLTVKNNGKNNRGTHMAVVYYKNNKIIGCDDTLFANVQSKGSVDYLESRYPTDSDYNTITPDRYEVYVNMSYDVRDMPISKWK